MSSVLVEHLLENQITVITINRPQKRNAVDQQTATELYHAFVEFDKNQNSKVAILTGAGNTFCAGADLQAIYSSSDQMNPLSDNMDDIGPMGVSRLCLSKPCIAAIEGYAVAGGLELACWCDLRVMHPDAKLGVFCRRFGVPLIDGGTIRLPQLIGLSRAMDLILTGREVSAMEALQMGLANYIDQHPLQKAISIATTLCQFPQLCLRNDRKSALDNATNGLSMKQLLAREFSYGKDTLYKELFPKSSKNELRQFFVENKGKHGTLLESKL